MKATSAGGLSGKLGPNAAPATLLAMLGAAFVLLAGGAWLARRTEAVSVAGDRVALQRYARECTDLCEQRQAIWHAVVTEQARKYRQAWESGEPLPIPDAEATDRSLLILETRAVSDEMPSLVPAPDRELLLLAYRTPAPTDDAAGMQILHVSVDLQAVRRAMSDDLKVWLDGDMAARPPAGETVRVVAPDGSVLFQTAAPDGPPSPPTETIVIPLPWGRWTVGVWDRTQTRVVYDRRILVGATAGSGLMTLLGLANFAAYRHVLRRATARVSFLNRLSHELRAPLTNVLLHLDLAKDGLEEASVPARRHLDLIREEARRLGRLVDNALQMLATEQGTARLHRQRCTPSAVVDSVIDQFQPALERRGIFVHRSGAGPATAEIDPEALAQIVANLLSNAEKYAPGAPVTIAERWTESHYELSIADNGPGIPAAASERVFHDWHRVSDRVAEGVTGLGLGLGIARELARRMDGDLRLVPSECGAAFVVSLPRMPCHEGSVTC